MLGEMTFSCAKLAAVTTTTELSQDSSQSPGSLEMFAHVSPFPLGWFPRSGDTGSKGKKISLF